MPIWDSLCSLCVCIQDMIDVQDFKTIQDYSRLPWRLPCLLRISSYVFVLPHFKTSKTVGCIIPVFVLSSAIFVSFQLCDLYGIALAALGMCLASPSWNRSKQVKNNTNMFAKSVDLMMMLICTSNCSIDYDSVYIFYLFSLYQFVPLDASQDMETQWNTCIGMWCLSDHLLAGLKIALLHTWVFFCFNLFTICPSSYPKTKCRTFTHGSVLNCKSLSFDIHIFIYHLYMLLIMLHICTYNVIMWFHDCFMMDTLYYCIHLYPLLESLVWQLAGWPPWHVVWPLMASDPSATTLEASLRWPFSILRHGMAGKTGTGRRYAKVCEDGVC